MESEGDKAAQHAKVADFYAMVQELTVRVVAHVCRAGGALDGVERISKEGHAQVLSVLAEIDSATVVEPVKSLLNDLERGSQIGHDVGSHVVWALEKIAFDSNTLEDGARLLLRLAVVQREKWVASPARQFKALFPVILGNTAADGDRRLALLKEALASEDPKQLEVVAGALTGGSRTSHFSRNVGAESFGSRPALQSWWPATRDQIDHYINSCVNWLGKLAERDDVAGSAARDGLAESLRSLIQEGFFDAVEKAVERVIGVAGPWPHALEALGKVLVHDGESLSREVAERVGKLIARLQPHSLESRIRFLVTEMPWNYPYVEVPNQDAKYGLKVTAVRNLTRELVKQPATLTSVLPALSVGHQRMAHVFGEELATTVRSPEEWLEPIIRAVAEAAAGTRNYELMSGYLAGIAKSHADLAEAAKRRVARSPQLAPALPQIYRRLHNVL